jgi:hypothetical protein
MKRLFSRIPLPHWSRTTSTGWLLSTLGLSTGGYGVARVAGAFAGQPASWPVLAATLLTGGLLSGTGFLLLVAGANPFDDADDRPAA